MKNETVQKLLRISRQTAEHYAKSECEAQCNYTGVTLMSPVQNSLCVYFYMTSKRTKVSINIPRWTIIYRYPAIKEIKVGIQVYVGELNQQRKDNREAKTE